jgi:hypothetical protein
MSDEMIKTRFTPALVRVPTDDIQKGPMRYDAPVTKGAKGNGGAGRSKAAAPKQRPADLRACPFCRELFVDDETDVCPECGIAVRDLASLPASPEAQALEAEEKRGVVPTVPQAEPLPWSHLGRGRGVLMLCAIAGMVAFYLPWAVQTVPETFTYTGSAMAHVKPFFWSAFTAWLVLFPAAASRRTILKMVGARVALVFLSAIPGVQAAMMLQLVPTTRVVKGIPFEFHWGPGLFLTLAVSAVATIFAFRFGGKLEDVETRKETSAGHVLH